MRHHKRKRMPFMAVIERTKLGWPHLHIMLRTGWLSAKLIRDTMQELTNSPIIKIERIHNQAKLAGYVAKYCGKDPHKFGTCKRYWQSKDYKEATPEKEHPGKRVTGTWSTWSIHIYDWILEMESLGYEVKRKSWLIAEARAGPGAKADLWLEPNFEVWRGTPRAPKGHSRAPFR